MAVPEQFQIECIILVTIGSVHSQDSVRSIECFECEMKSFFEMSSIKRVFKTKMSHAALKENTNIDRSDLGFCLQQCALQNLKSILIIPFFLIPGKEFHQIIQIGNQHKQQFSRILISHPLLCGDLDYEKVCAAYVPHIEQAGTDAVLFVGHGTTHPSQACYYKLENYFQRQFQNVFVGTIAEKMSQQQVLRKLREYTMKSITLFPLLMTAGMHAYHDVAGKNGSGWSSFLSSQGYAVTINPITCAELHSIRSIFIDHALKACE